MFIDEYQAWRVSPEDDNEYPDNIEEEKHDEEHKEGRPSGSRARLSHQTHT